MRVVTSDHKSDDGGDGGRRMQSQKQEAHTDVGKNLQDPTGNKIVSSCQRLCAGLAGPNGDAPALGSAESTKRMGCQPPDVSSRQLP